MEECWVGGGLLGKGKATHDEDGRMREKVAGGGGRCEERCPLVVKGGRFQKKYIP